MLLLAILVLPVVLSADREWNFGKYIVKANAENALTSIEKSSDEPLLQFELPSLGLESIHSIELDNVTTVKRLNLTNNWISSISPKVFSNLTNLEHLSLAHNSLSHLNPSTFIGLTNLQTLDLSSNSLDHIGESYFYGLSTWVDVHTSGNVLSNISTLLFEAPYGPRKGSFHADEGEVTKRLTTKDSKADNFTTVKVCSQDDVVRFVEVLREGANLEPYCIKVKVVHTDLKLSLRSLDIYDFANDWYRVLDLPVRKLDLSYNRMRSITADLLNELPESIVEVDLSHNKYISFLTTGVINNLYIRSLNLDYGGINKVDDDAFANTNLTFLSFNNNGLSGTKFVESLSSSLVELHLRGNGFREISNGSFSKLKQLVKLDLSSNYLATLERGFFRNFGQLRELNISRNGIRLYKGLFEGLESLEYLNIARMNLRSITKDTLFGMPDTLSTVVLDSNGIESLEPGSFIRVPKHKLSLEGNLITTIPKGSFDLPSLEELNLGDNSLVQFDSNSFKGLASLKRLSLANNNMTKLERGVLKYLTKLEVLDLSSNPIRELTRGALNGMVKSREGAVLLSGVPLEHIQGSIFDYTL